MKTLLLVHRPGPIVDTDVAVALNQGAASFLSRQNIPFKEIGDYIKPWDYDSLYKERNRLYYSWVGNLNYKGVDLWKTLENEFCELNLEVVMVYTSVIDAIIRKEKPKKIIAQPGAGLYYLPRDRGHIPYIARTLAHHHRIPFNLAAKRPLKDRLLQPLIYPAIALAKKYWNIRRRSMHDYSTRKPCVLLFMHGTGFDKLIPVQHELGKLGYNAVAICSDGIRESRSAKAFKGRSFAYVDAFLGKAPKLSPQKVKKALYRKIDIFPVVREQFNYAYDYSLPANAGLADSFDRIFTKFAPSFIVTANEELSFGRTAVLTARKHDVPSLLVQHSYPVPASGRLNPVSDYFATWFPVKGMKSIVTGSSKYPELSQLPKCSSKNPKILFAARYPVSRDAERIRLLSENLPRGVGAVVKIHPAEITPAITTYPNIIYRQKEPFNEILAESNIVVTTDECTTCLDAVMAEKAIIVPDYEESFDQRYVGPVDIRGEPFLRVKSPAQFTKAVGNLLSEKNRRKLENKAAEFNRKYNEGKDPGKIIAEFIHKKIR